MMLGTKLLTWFRGLNRIEKGIFLGLIGLFGFLLLAVIFANLEQILYFIGQVFSVLTFIAIPSAFLWVFHKIDKEKTERRLKAKKEYDDALSDLRKNPKNSDLRTRALDAGRNYYGIMRGSAISIYDEQAIQNDLSTIYNTDLDS